MVIDTEKFARRCDVTGKGMNDGYCINDGEKYIAEHFAMLQHITDETEYNTIEEAHKDDYYYWTEWEIEEGENYFDADGNEYDENGILVNCLFNEEPESLPQELQDVLNAFAEKDGDGYENCAELVKELNKIGYTCEYYLDAQPYNLRKI